jgi:hypothetical protein
MDITPHLGIGDLLIIKMKEISNHLTIKNININSQLIRTYSSNYDVKINFIQEFLQLLFNSTITITNGPCNYAFDHYTIQKTYIYDDIFFKNKMDTMNTDTIIFHTKLRHDGLIDKFINEILQSLILFFKQFKTTKTILIMGEKYIGNNLETQIHKTQSLYNYLLILKDNNKVIDLTTDYLTEGNDNFDSFLNDIEMINKATCNVTFGIGGPFTLCKAFSKKNISFIPFYNLSVHKNSIIDPLMTTNSLVTTVDALNETLSKI